MGECPSQKLNIQSIRWSCEISYPFIILFFPLPGKLPVLKITVTPQISSDTFRSIWKSSQKSSITRKKRYALDICVRELQTPGGTVQSLGTQQDRWCRQPWILSCYLEPLVLGNSSLNHSSIMMDVDCTKIQVLG